MRQNFFKVLQNLKIFATAEKIYKCRHDQRKRGKKPLGSEASSTFGRSITIWFILYYYWDY